MEILSFYFYFYHSLIFTKQKCTRSLLRTHVFTAEGYGGKWSCFGQKWFVVIWDATANGKTTRLSISHYMFFHDSTLKLLRLYTRYFFSFISRWYTNLRYTFGVRWGFKFDSEIIFFQLVNIVPHKPGCCWSSAAYTQRNHFCLSYAIPFDVSYWDLYLKNGICTELVLIYNVQCKKAATTFVKR